jgi:hypothetical protein
MPKIISTPRKLAYGDPMSLSFETGSVRKTEQLTTSIRMGLNVTGLIPEAAQQPCPSSRPGKRSPCKVPRRDKRTACNPRA